jgi:hypothetical protein
MICKSVTCVKNKLKLRTIIHPSLYFCIRLAKNRNESKFIPVPKILITISIYLINNNLHLQVN